MYPCSSGYWSNYLHTAPPRSTGVIGAQFICRTGSNRRNSANADLLGNKEPVIISSDICWQRGQAGLASTEMFQHRERERERDLSDRELVFHPPLKWMLLPKGPLCQSATFQPNNLHHKQSLMMHFELISCLVKHWNDKKFKEFVTNMIWNQTFML